MLCLDRRALKGEIWSWGGGIDEAVFFLPWIMPPLRCCYLKRHHCEIASIVKQQTHIECERMRRMWGTGLITNYTVWCISACQVSFFQVSFPFSGSRHLMELLSGSELWEEREQMEIPSLITLNTWPWGHSQHHRSVYMKERQKDAGKNGWQICACLTGFSLQASNKDVSKKVMWGRWGRRRVRGRCTWEISDPTGCLESSEHMWYWYDHSHILTTTDNEVNYSWRQYLSQLKGTYSLIQ